MLAASGLWESHVNGWIVEVLSFCFLNFSPLLRQSDNAPLFRFFLSLAPSPAPRPAPPLSPAALLGLPHLWLHRVPAGSLRARSQPGRRGLQCGHHGAQWCQRSGHQELHGGRPAGELHCMPQPSLKPGLSTTGLNKFPFLPLRWRSHWLSPSPDPEAAGVSARLEDQGGQETTGGAVVPFQHGSDYIWVWTLRETFNLKNAHSHEVLVLSRFSQCQVKGLTEGLYSPCYWDFLAPPSGERAT